MAASTPLTLKHFPAGEHGFFRAPVLISGSREAVLIDGGFTLPDGKVLVEAIKASGKTAAQVAREAGTTPRNLSQIVTGENANPKYQLLVRIAQAAKTTLGALAGESIRMSAVETGFSRSADWP